MPKCSDESLERSVNIVRGCLGRARERNNQTLSLRDLQFCLKDARSNGEEVIVPRETHTLERMMDLYCANT